MALDRKPGGGHAPSIWPRVSDVRAQAEAHSTNPHVALAYLSEPRTPAARPMNGTASSPSRVANPHEPVDPREGVTPCGKPSSSRRSERRSAKASTDPRV